MTQRKKFVGKEALTGENEFRMRVPLWVETSCSFLCRLRRLLDMAMIRLEVKLQLSFGRVTDQPSTVSIMVFAATAVLFVVVVVVVAIGQNSNDVEYEFTNVGACKKKKFKK
jgi:hypothetical protein